MNTMCLGSIRRSHLLFFMLILLDTPLIAKHYVVNTIVGTVDRCTSLFFLNYSVSYCLDSPFLSSAQLTGLQLQRK